MHLLRTTNNHFHWRDASWERSIVLSVNQARFCKVDMAKDDHLQRYFSPGKSAPGVKAGSCIRVILAFLV
ncbi:MAG: hypothetical protein MJE77_24890 [Proteobacteria bacterium]|nr:hypothetical protein [Pseudomonadota bacterium]